MGVLFLLNFLEVAESSESVGGCYGFKRVLLETLVLDSEKLLGVFLEKSQISIGLFCKLCCVNKI